MASKRWRKGEGNYFELLPEEINIEILSRLSFSTVFQVKMVCNSWRTIICSSPQFQKLWDERNSDEWLVTDDCDGGVDIFNGSGGFKKKMFDSSSNWLLKAVSGGLLLYQHKSEGLLRIVNPLTMEARQLTDPILGEQRLSFYLKKNSAVHAVINLTVDSTTKTYQVIILSRMNQIANILIYRSSTSSWEIKVVGNISGRMSYWAPYKTVHNQTVYCLPFKGHGLPSYNISGEIVDAEEKYGGSEMRGFVMGEKVKVATWSPPIGRSFLFVFELDETSSQWKLVCVCRWKMSCGNRVSIMGYGELLCEKDFVLNSVGASNDCIWIKPSDENAYNTRLTLHQKKDIFKGYKDIFKGNRQNKSKAFPTPLSFLQCP